MALCRDRSEGDLNACRCRAGGPLHLLQSFLYFLCVSRLRASFPFHLFIPFGQQPSAMTSQGPEAFYAALRAKPDNLIKFGKAQAVVLTPAGQPDQQLKLPTDEEVGLASASGAPGYRGHMHKQRTHTAFLWHFAASRVITC